MEMTKKLYNAIEAYYRNRARQSVQPWDKAADLDAIDAAATKYHFEAISGTFFFSRNTRRYRVTWQTNEAAFPGFARSRQRLELSEVSSDRAIQEKTRDGETTKAA